MFWGRRETEAAGFVGGVVHPGESEEKLTMLGDPLEEGGLRQGFCADAGAQEAPEVVVMAGHAKLSRFARRPERFLVKKAGLFPERAFGGEHPD